MAFCDDILTSKGKHLHHLPFDSGLPSTNFLLLTLFCGRLSQKENLDRYIVPGICNNLFNTSA